MVADFRKFILATLTTAILFDCCPGTTDFVGVGVAVFCFVGVGVAVAFASGVGVTVAFFAGVGVTFCVGVGVAFFVGVGVAAEFPPEEFVPAVLIYEALTYPVIFLPDTVASILYQRSPLRVLAEPMIVTFCPCCRVPTQSNLEPTPARTFR